MESLVGTIRFELGSATVVSGKFWYLEIMGH